MIRILLIGSNFLSALVLTRLCGFNDSYITVLDRRDPTVIKNFNQDVFRIMQRWCKNLRYRDLYNGTEFGDPKRNIKIKFIFKDWVNESLSNGNYDIIFHTGNIYDSLYAQANPTDTYNVNVKGTMNILNNLDSIVNSSGEKNPLFIQMSSINVYGDQTNNNGDEEITEDKTVPNPQDVLNFSLFTQENLVKGLIHKYGCDYMTLRLGTLIGDFTPLDSLVTAAMTALILQKDSFEVYNSQNSIELLASRDFEGLITNIIQMYKEYDEEKWSKVVNQVYNIKCEEPQIKTVETVVRSIYDEMVPKLPRITSEHGIKGIDNLKLKAPKLKFIGLGQGKPNIKWDKPISIAKAKEVFKFLPQNPLVMTMVPHTASFLLNYVTVGFSDEEREAFKKIFYLPSTPTPQTVDNSVHNDVKVAVDDINKQIEKDLDN